MNCPLPFCLCLNPDCAEEHRMCGDEEGHSRCDGWVHPLVQLRNMPIKKSLFLDGVSADYLLDPIGSIYQLEQYSTTWESSLVAIFQQVRRTVDDELTAAYARCRTSIAHHMAANRHLFAKIQCFSEGMAMGQSEQVFDEYLQEDLRAIQQAGCIYLPDHTTINNFLQGLMKEINAIQQTLFWKEEPWNINQRIEAQKRKEQLYYFTERATIQEANEKIQQLQNICGRKLRLAQLNKSAQVECLFCPLVLTLQDTSSKNCRRRCRLSILNHMCTSHTKQIIQRGPAAAVRISLEGLRAEVGRRGVKRAAIVDRQNMHVTLPPDSNTYCLQVVSLNGLHLATGKHILAESKGRDAADLLIMLILHQLALLRVKEVVLYTKDHFGATIVPIFAQLGLTVSIATGLS